MGWREMRLCGSPFTRPDGIWFCHVQHGIFAYLLYSTISHTTCINIYCRWFSGVVPEKCLYKSVCSKITIITAKFHIVKPLCLIRKIVSLQLRCPCGCLLFTLISKEEVARETVLYWIIQNLHWESSLLTNKQKTTTWPYSKVFVL